MFFTGFLSAIYLSIASFAFLMSYDEQKANKIEGVMPKALSFLACLFWPVTLFAVFLTEWRRVV